ncbi:MAG: hypothetical protein LBR73_04660 [Oscillospiraceae bacterium]|jgi:hypothetical protein|nr:hypothetical protein [Oscillospiraceae bacterium]
MKRAIYPITILLILVIFMSCDQTNPEKPGSFASRVSSAAVAVSEEEETKSGKAEEGERTEEGAQPPEVEQFPVLDDATAKREAVRLWQQGFDVWYLFASGIPESDEYVIAEPTVFEELPENEYFPVGDNALGITDIASLKAYVEAAYTAEAAAEEFYGADRDDLPGEKCGNYYERDGILYIQYGGIGDPGNWLTDTAKVVSQDGGTAVIEMDFEDSMDGSHPITWELKYEGDAWKLNCSIFGVAQ